MYVKYEKYNLLERLEQAKNQGDLIYSLDGKELKFAHSRKEKIHAIFSNLFNPDVFREKKDCAFLSLFRDDMKPFISAIKQEDDKETKRWFASDSEWDLDTFDCIRRNPTFHDPLNQIKKAQPACETYSVIDGQIVFDTYIKIDDQKIIEIDDQKILNLGSVSTVFRAASIAHRYVQYNVFGRKNFGQGTYVGEMKDGKAVGKGVYYFVPEKLGLPKLDCVTGEFKEGPAQTLHLITRLQKKTVYYLADCRRLT